MDTWQNVRSGFVNHWTYTSTWVVLVVTLAVSAPLTWYLIRRRRWPTLSTSAATVWACFIIASTWRLRSTTLHWDGLWNPSEGMVARLASMQEWQRAVDYILYTGPFVIADTLLFVPFGGLLVAASRRFLVSLSVCVVLVLVVEGQQALSRGGIELLDDVLANIAGAATGVIVGFLILRFLNRDGGAHGGIFRSLGRRLDRVSDSKQSLGLPRRDCS